MIIQNLFNFQFLKDISNELNSYMFFLYQFICSKKDEYNIFAPNPYNNQISKMAFHENIDTIHITDNINCTAPHTIMSENKTCACENWYEFGDPSKSLGCWQCRQLCLSNSHCAYPGICKCLPGFIKSQYNSECYPIAPNIISITPEKIPITGRYFINITFGFNANITFTDGFCKFGDEIVKGIVLLPSILTCLSPPRNASIINLSISFDKKTWSRELYQIEYVKILNVKLISYTLYFFSCFFGIISIYLFCTLNPKISEVESDKNGNENEKEPFKGGKNKLLAESQHGHVHYELNAIL